jgi:hypothetical protein
MPAKTAVKVQKTAQISCQKEVTTIIDCVSLSQHANAFVSFGIVGSTQPIFEKI